MLATKRTTLLSCQEGSSLPITEIVCPCTSLTARLWRENRARAEMCLLIYKLCRMCQYKILAWPDFFRTLHLSDHGAAGQTQTLSMAVGSSAADHSLTSRERLFCFVPQADRPCGLCPGLPGPARPQPSARLHMCLSFCTLISSGTTFLSSACSSLRGLCFLPTHLSTPWNSSSAPPGRYLFRQLSC